MKSFGMVRDLKEEELAMELFDCIAEDKELCKDVFKATVYSILRIDSEENSHPKIASSEISKRFHVFYLNKMLQSTASRNKKQISSQSNTSFTKTNPSNLLTVNTQTSNTDLNRKLQPGSKRNDHSQDQTSSQNTGHEKCLSLYNLSKQPKNQAGRSNEEVEYERAKDELTFAPVVHR
eukprot:TRINITY_DN7814_c0_g1_i10.p5 TRINITY_DN7814_c0_g1~~TRINITY_DN7814_c0_g1_i10.p5  ORF type:complete len:178 (-),score=46.24 TRINITY_DN7814_c0_g1_i10:547-1080(-)